MKEIWKPIKDQPDYFVSSCGNIRFKDGKIKKPKLYGGDRYLRIFIGGKKYFVHRLVAKAFLDNPDNNSHVYHKNDDIYDNRVENLEWGKSKEISKRIVDSGSRLKKISLEDKEKIISLYRNGYSAREIGKIYGLSPEGILQHIRKSNVPVRNVGGKKMFDNPTQIIDDYQNNIPIKEIAQKNKCSSSTIRKYLKNANINIKRKTIFDDPTKLISDYKNNLTLKEIARKNNCSYTSVENKINQLIEQGMIKKRESLKGGRCNHEKYKKQSRYV